jgi:thiol-disulfide isomerase/thioredoxin
MSEGQGWWARLRSAEARPLRKRLMIAVDVVLLLVVGTLLVQRALPQAAAAFNLGSGNEPAPGFALRSLDGAVVSLDRYRGQVVLVNFWASWCPPCRVEMPAFERVYRERRDDGFVILGIATDTHAGDAIRKFITDHDITYPILLADRQVVGITVASAPCLSPSSLIARVASVTVSSAILPNPPFGLR